MDKKELKNPLNDYIRTEIAKIVEKFYSKELGENIWAWHLSMPIDEACLSKSLYLKLIKIMEWYFVFDLIEFIAHQFDIKYFAYRTFEHGINLALEKTGYSLDKQEIKIKSEQENKN